MADLVYMGINHWHTIKQRPQHLAEGLSQRHRVIYVNPVGVSRWGKQHRILDYKAHAIDPGSVVKIDSNLYLYNSPLAWFPLNFHLGFVNWLNHWLASMRLKRILSDLDWQNDWLWTSTPNHVDMAAFLPTRKICYDCMDLYHSFWSSPLRRRLVEKQESRLLAAADLVLVSSQALREHVMRRGTAVRSVHLVPNGVHVHHFGRQVPEQEIAADLAPISRPVAGYVGTISHWFDMALVQDLLSAFPDLSVVCVGPAEVDLQSHRQTERLHFLGPRSYHDLPRYLAGFDVLLIPFVINELVSSVNPVKVYEYLATGKPVVASAMRELQALDDVCYLALDSQAFINAVDRALAEKKERTPYGELQARRRAVAAQNSWQRRIDQINGLMEEGL